MVWPTERLGGGGSRRWAVVVAVAITGFASLAVAHPGDDGHHYPEPLTATKCYSCHMAPKWTPPLQAMATIVPASTLRASAGGEVDYNIQVTNSWQAAIVGFNACLDISNAPGLRFVGNHEPIVGQEMQITVPSNPTAPGTAQQAAVSFDMPPAASRIRIQAIPHSADAVTGPDAALIIVPPGSQPITIDHNRTGQPEALVLDGAQAQLLAPGNWSLAVRLPPTLPPPPGLPGLPPTDRDFRIIIDAEFDAGKLNVYCQRVEARIEKYDTSPSVAWHLRVNSLLNGTLNITVASTAFYQHSSNAPDYGNVTQSLVVPLELQGDKLTFVRQELAFVRPVLINGPTMATASEAVGYAAAFLIISSIASGGMFGKASRRSLNNLFGSAKRRVAFHNFLSYGLMAAALVHTVLFLIEPRYSWTLGIIWGGLGILAMAGLGVTGALQVILIRRWSYGTWRWTHYGMAVAAILFTALHGLLDGSHFGAVQSWLHWQDPLGPGA